MGKMFENRINPMAEVYYINEQDNIELMDFANRHRSKEGIRETTRTEEERVMESPLITVTWKLEQS